MEDGSVFSLQEIGMKLLTNSDVKKPHDCLERVYNYAFYYGRSRAWSFLVRVWALLLLEWVYPAEAAVPALQIWWTLRSPWPSTPGRRC